MDTPLTINAATESIRHWAFSDSLVHILPADISEALQLDYEIAERYPTEKECEELVCGGDEGQVPEELQGLFPNTDALLASHWE